MAQKLITDYLQTQNTQFTSKSIQTHVKQWLKINDLLHIIRKIIKDK